MADPAGTAARGRRASATRTPSATIHTLPNQPSDDQLRTYAHGMVALNAEREQLRAKINAFRKQARGHGIELGAMDRRIKRLEWTTKEIKDDWQTELRYAELLGQPIGAQLEAFSKPDAADEEKERVQWYAAGRMHGLAGKGDAAEPPDGCPPECRRAYGDGWEKGQGETQEAFLRAAAAKGTA